MQEKEMFNFQDFVDQSSNSIIYTDEKYKIQYVNKAFEDLYGWSLEELIGKKSFEVFSADHPPEEAREKICNSIDSKHTLVGEEIFQRKDGTFFFCKHSTKPLFNENGKIYGYLGLHSDITEQRSIKNKLSESEERLQTLYENMPGAMLIIGRDYIIKDVNYRTCEITGFKREELIGQLCDKLCPKGSASKKCPIWEEGNYGFHGMDTTIKCLNSSKKPIIKNAKVVTIDGEEYILENFQDISELKETQEDLTVARMNAEEASRAKSDFLATMSHELRTPLNSIIGFSQLMTDETYGSLNENQKRYSSHITNSGIHLLGLINNILDISKIEAGKMELNCEHFTVKEIVDDVEALVYPIATKKNISVKIDIPLDDIEIYGDRTKFKQIMYNLMNNAVKFTPENGSIHISAKNDEEHLLITVADTGIGIAQHEQEMIFHPFRQVDSAESRKYQGTGLGLTLVKQFMELHNGTIDIESEVGKGSTFRLRAPLKQAID